MAESETNPGNGSGSRRSNSPIAFQFDARSKSIVPGVFALEAKRMKRLFARKPKISLQQLETALKQSATEEMLKKSIPKFSAYYTHSSHGHQFLESLGRLLLEAASKEEEDGERQWFLLLQALEVLEHAIQISPKVINVSCQSIIVSIYSILGAPYRETFYLEKEIHKEMMTMINIKKDPNDFASREKIIKLYLRGRNYYPALVHTAEYEKVMQVKSRSLYRQKQGELAFRKAGIFQAMVDFYQRMATSKEEGETNKFAEMARLNGFISRFNRDNRRINIVPLKSLDLFALNKTIQSIVAIANNFYEEAGKSEYFLARHKAYFFMARNNWQFDNPKGAQTGLAEAVRLVELSRMAPSDKSREKLKLLEFLNTIYTELGHGRKADETAQQIARLRKESRGAGMAQSA